MEIKRKRDRKKILYFFISLSLFSLCKFFLLFENNMEVNAIKITSKIEAKDSIADLLKDILGEDLIDSETKKVSE